MGNHPCISCRTTWYYHQYPGGYYGGDGAHGYYGYGYHGAYAGYGYYSHHHAYDNYDDDYYGLGANIPPPPDGYWIATAAAAFQLKLGQSVLQNITEEQLFRFGMAIGFGMHIGICQSNVPQIFASVHECLLGHGVNGTVAGTQVTIDPRIDPHRLINPRMWAHIALAMADAQRGPPRVIGHFTSEERIAPGADSEALYNCGPYMESKRIALASVLNVPLASVHIIGIHLNNGTGQWSRTVRNDTTMAVLAASGAFRNGTPGNASLNVTAPNGTVVNSTHASSQAGGGYALVTRDRADHHVIKNLIHLHIFRTCHTPMHDHHVMHTRTGMRCITHKHVGRLTKRDLSQKVGMYS